MHYYEVAPLKIIRAGDNVFTYQSPDPLSAGQLVMIEVGRTTQPGLVIKAAKKPSYTTKPITSLLAEPALPQPLVDTLQWMAQYYVTPLATVLQTALPRGLTKTRRARHTVESNISAKNPPFVLTGDQRAAINTLDHQPSGTLLLHGITGSGKTAVYLDQAKKATDAGKSVVILVPEISLTSQLVKAFSAQFDTVLLTHSRQTEAERHSVWRTALRRDQPVIVIGPRSALFLPLRDVGLIVVDEMHEPSYKQEQSPRYSALRVASVLGSHHHAKVILGSATPPVAEYYLASKSTHPIITMSQLARTDAVRPQIHLVDMTKRANFSRHRFLSNTLFTQLERTFESGDQALLFHNRRGSASTTLCENCGWSAGCPRCFIPLTLHTDRHELRCHSCGRVETVPTSCPVCHSADIIHKGIGTKLIESELRKLFPSKVIARFDGDSDQNATVEQQYDALTSGQIDLIIGTQVIAKGLDLPKLRLVGVVQADAGLSLPDYSSSERTFQLLAQVVGRVGRSHHPTNVVIQSFQPEHPAVKLGIDQNYADFYTQTLAIRQRALFPPYRFLLKLVCTYKTEKAAIMNSKKLAADLRTKLPATVEILGPTPAFYERQRDTYRWQLVLRSPHRAELVAALAHLPSSYWQYELDPTSLL